MKRKIATPKMGIYYFIISRVYYRSVLFTILPTHLYPPRMSLHSQHRLIPAVAEKLLFIGLKAFSQNLRDITQYDKCSRINFFHQCFQ